VRLTVPYVIVPMKRTAQMPVMIPPMGKIKICKPGTTNGAFAATTRVWRGGWAVTTACAKTPFTNVASDDESVVLTMFPDGSTPVKVTTGTRIFSYAAL
jgi:hypothetical protein